MLIDEVERFSAAVTDQNVRWSIKTGALERTYKPDSVPPHEYSESGVIISLGIESPRSSSDLPGDLGWASLAQDLPAFRRPGRPPIWSCSRRRLPCHLCHHKCGGLLPRRFTLA